MRFKVFVKRPIAALMPMKKLDSAALDPAFRGTEAPNTA